MTPSIVGQVYRGDDLGTNPLFNDSLIKLPTIIAP
jgi:hypothetical protein